MKVIFLDIDGVLNCEDFYTSGERIHDDYEEEQLKYMEKSGIENYIIIDDDSDMLYGQRRHFVHVLPSPRNMSGFNEEYYNQALNILNKNIIQINFN